MTGSVVVRPDAALIRDGSGLVCVGGGGDALRFGSESAELTRAALGHLAEPLTLEALRAHLERDAGQAIDPALIEALVAPLKRAGVLGAVVGAAAPPSLAGVRVLLAVCGAIAAVDAPRTALALQARGAEVRVALSKAALRFVSQRALEAITHAAVPFRLVSTDPGSPVPHIELAEWADAMLVAPASATTMARVAHGDCSDLIGALVVATRAPVLFAPSMNAAMWSAPATRRNARAMVGDGYAVVEPRFGLEMADRPGGRRRKLGSILPPERLVRALEVWLRHRAPEVFRGAIEWDAVYRAPAGVPWLGAGLDELSVGALAQHAPPPGRFLDLGCGTGEQSRAAAALGYSVVGVDGSEAALDLAQARTPGGAAGDVLFVQGDILDLRLRSTFDVLFDRGTLHTLRRGDVVPYGRALARLSRAGSVLLIIHDGPSEKPTAATLRLSSIELAALLPDFELIESTPATLRAGEDGAALRSLLRARPR